MGFTLERKGGAEHGSAEHGSNPSQPQGVGAGGSGVCGRPWGMC